MDDEGETKHSTPLPGASSIPASVPIAAPVPQPQQPSPPQPPVEKPTDHVCYEHRPDDLPPEARARAKAAKVKVQSHYRLLLETAIDLNTRAAELERSFAGAPEDRQLRGVGRNMLTQSQLLRLRRTKSD